MRDVIVIGSGGGGPVVAKELAARGLDVLLLEAGPRNGKVEEAWSHFEDDQNNLFKGALRWGPAARAKTNWFRETPQRSYITQVAGVGGTTNHYFGNCPRAMPGVFAGYDGADRGAYDVAHLFPFTYRELVPYYRWVEHVLPVQTAAMGTKEQVFFKGCEGIGLPVQTTKDVSRDAFRPQENSILQPQGNAGKTTSAALLRYPQAQGCTYCGYCYQGCKEPIRSPANLKAKRATSTSYVPMALTADLWMPGGKAVSLVANAFVTKVLTATESGQVVAKGVTWRDTETGLTYTEDAKVVVMSAGCIEDPRLWLNSGLPNPNGWVGKGLTDHALDWVIGVMPYDTNSSKGPASAARADFPGVGCVENVGLPPALQGLTASFSDSGVRGAYNVGRGETGPWTGETGRAMGHELKDLLSNVNRLLNVLVLTDDDVEEQNRVTLSSVFPADEHGKIPKVEIQKRQRSTRTLNNRRKLAERAAQILKAAGATKVIRPDFPPLLLHMQSSMRMGTDPATSVLDANAEARWVKRLFVADNAALANACGGMNPTLTTQALATRTSEKIFQLYFGGSPWVGRESPLSSVDDRVTQAVIQRGL
ncbi:GMC family oxidoreductase N-terminal domain-containing protein [Aquabacterium sp.]|uniref:GMC family oxidoreductase N-terminal domain-containing protein n=1 Tax=Aquabacterium sp. TaxID=1872578 RepID=UPI003D6CC078